MDRRHGVILLAEIISQIGSQIKREFWVDRKIPFNYIGQINANRFSAGIRCSLAQVVFPPGIDLCVLFVLFEFNNLAQEIVQYAELDLYNVKMGTPAKPYSYIFSF